ncbi:MAG: carbohydrate-binding module family 14 protein [Alphaproteobacteria bacterium]|nr:carbohydrate-binding module family 14 protein [Alphaproteobacteria bacterium]
MKTLAVVLLATGMALSAVAPSFAGDAKKCAEGTTWDEATQKCVPKG